MMKEVLDIKALEERSNNHLMTVGKYADAFLKRRSLHLKHPVYDFLFTYYSFSPLKLKQWVPSFNQVISCDEGVFECYPWFAQKPLVFETQKIYLDKERLSKSVLGLVEFIHDLCMNIASKPPKLGCFGLHEWAMVYKVSHEKIRHNGHTLRMSPEAINDFVDSQNLLCTHYDAYRFFTSEATPKNVHNPTLDSRIKMEQGGCIHANMDIYKWATKLWPWVGSDFIGKTFLLAVEGRELDMRASPYDLSEEGFSPIQIETERGRKQYQKEQAAYAEKSAKLRDELKMICKNLLGKDETD